MNARTQAAGPPAAPTARMALAVAAGAFRNTTGNATIAEIVTAATAATAAIAVGGDATEINEITGGAVGAATGDYTARRWRPESVLTGNTIAEIVTAATAAIAAIAVGGDATEINEITGGAVGAATTDINAKPTWQPEPGSLSLAATLPGPER